MKGYGKRIWAIAFALILSFTTVLPVLADGDDSRQKGNESFLPRASQETSTEVFSTSKVNMTLTVKRADDSFWMYQVAKMDWSVSPTTGASNAQVKWVEAVEDWLTENGYTDAKYATPSALGLETNREELLIALLKAMWADNDLMDELKKADNHLLTAYHDDEASGEKNSSTTTDPASIATVTDSGDTGDTGIAYLISNIPLGLYFIAAENDVREYQPLLVDLVPKQTGPSGHWYIDATLSASLKYEQVEIDKKINYGVTDVGTASDGKYDIYRAGEIVSFKVSVEVPKYQKINGNYQFTTFNAFDEMAQGYDLVALSAKLYYKDKDGNKINPVADKKTDQYGNLTVFDKGNGSYNAVLASGAHVYYIGDQNVFYGVDVTSAGQPAIQYYGKVNGSLESIGVFTDTSANWTNALKNYNTKLTAAHLPTIATGTIQKRDYRESLISISFDYTVLMESFKYKEAREQAEKAGTTLTGTHEDSEVFVPDTFYVEYDAIINDKSYIGEEGGENTNTATLYYVDDSTGHIGTTEKQTTAWTYAMNLLKVDGSTMGIQQVDGEGHPVFEEDGVTPVYADPTPLAGAVFDLYRLEDIYCGGESAADAPTEADYKNYNWYQTWDGQKDYTTASTGWKNLMNKSISYYYYMHTDEYAKLESALEVANTGITSYQKLDQYMVKYAALTGYTPEGEDATPVAGYPELKATILPFASNVKLQYVPEKVHGCEKAPGKDHYHLAVYVVYKDDITSTESLDGVVVNGLDPNTYLLVETKAPDDYNALSEAIQFTIEQYDNDQFTAAGNSYKGFIDDEEQDCEDGIYHITVQNFKGLTLPSTGGIGTTLFTIIGIVIMSGAMIVIFIKRKNQDAAY